AQRGYLLTGDGRYLESWPKRGPRLSAMISELRSLTSDNPGEQERLAALVPLLQGRMAGLDRSIDLASRGDHAGAMENLRAQDDLATMDGLRRAVAIMDRFEQELLARRTTESADSSRSMLVSIAISVLIGVALVYLVFALSRR